MQQSNPPGPDDEYAEDAHAAIREVALPEDAQMRHEMAALGELFQQHSSGATWFYWVAALSMINSVLVHFNVGGRFLIGLEVTRIVDHTIVNDIFDNPEQATTLTAIAIGINLVICGVVAGFGWLALRGHLWAFILGTVLFFLDGLMLLDRGLDWLGILFHLFVLFFFVRGIMACMKLRQFGAFERQTEL